MKIVQALEDSNILFEGITKVVEKETKEKKGAFFGMFVATLGASLLGNMLSTKGILRVGYGNRKQKTVKTDYYFKRDF